MPITRSIRGAERAAASLRGIQAADLKVKISLSHYTPPWDTQAPSTLFSLLPVIYFHLSFNLLSVSCAPIKEMLSTQSSKYVNMVCSSPHLGISGAVWLFVKHFCFCKVYLSGFHIITLAGQTLNRSGEKVLRGTGGRENSSMELAQLFFLQGKGD